MLSVILHIIDAVILIYLLCISIYDIQTKTIKDKALLGLLPLTAGRAAINILISIAAGNTIWRVILNQIGGFLFPFVLLLVVSMCTQGGIGGGDIKLAGLLGLAVGFFDSLPVLIVGFVGACIMCLVKSYRYRTKHVSLALAPYLSAGYLLYVIHPIIMPILS